MEDERVQAGAECPSGARQAPASAAAATSTALPNSLERPASEEGAPGGSTDPGCRKQSPSTATCRRGRMPSAQQIRTLSTRAHPYRASSPLPRRPRQVEGVGAVKTGGSLAPGAAEGLPYPG